MSEPLLFKDEVHRVIRACMAVHNDKGNGYVEPVYPHCLEIELTHQGIPFDAQRNFPIHYRGVPLRHTYTPDFLCYEKIVVEIKATKNLADEHRAPKS